MNKAEILAHLPYTKPFLFVDELEAIDENGVTGSYTFDADLDFYKGHFKDHPVTPGVILTETMAQIGLVCLGIYLSGSAEGGMPGHVMLTSTAIDFMKPVFPGEKVTVNAQKVYFRFKKLNCTVQMTNAAGEVVCKGTIAGMVTNKMNA
ncbi:MULTISPECIES: 3-hydroxyacyl-ACP dehydratase FabZ family protein [Pedobacter]|uniref:Beta-hydroxyacyl-(Acyl-carrier-protein) dehydratase FabA/FabZ n=1 Tax=Pedobacter heparinus (strain ATCC 13125 / DSM 2366 / CIP 104194 / JCM 7457 / NBRC 12017 / NCIMB 9290 / NRRL B-14731 / HIM 762-3) TaxID=485917 RepID=C6XUK4_PEDHD|nr:MULTISPECIES: 3-hydroxyacyl-ACP dehydratase FabZ family protein [Pedobacter]ACU03854.1 Beta-hydroxyacyl-(acyl-carrier-protein) dehydratase FabA/FabZ [Pedobacter heparinus DSM 2366]MBB5436624.1 3-hydroxyacyl-[acyl-carrier-protein] dehydratase [Pedobacter sp. AK017]